jgi:DNA-binding NtrC family response regulator
MNILIVDDEPVLLESIKIGLQNLGYEVTTANCAEQALGDLPQEPGASRIGLVITDYLMPGMNGIDFLLALRKWSPNLPVLIMSAHAEPELVVEAFRYQCDGFFEKPILLSQLVKEIERIAHKHSESKPSSKT